MSHAQFKKVYFLAQPVERINADGNDDPQCVDVDKLYWRKVFGIECGDFNGRASRADQNTFPGGIRLSPGPLVALQPGDALVFSPTTGNPYGHTGMVDEVYPDGYSLMEQLGSYAFKGKTVAGVKPRIKRYYRASKLIKNIWRRA